MLDHFSESILCQIPNVADSRTDNGLPLLQPEDERYTYAEAFRSLRSSLIFLPNQAELKTILITSAIPNEGKSTIASNLARDHFRSARYRYERVTDFDDDEHDFGNDFSFPADERGDVVNALAKLSPDHREVLILRFYHDLKLEEIAEVTGTPLGTVKSRLVHAL
jgi:DNA-directed RNA polymerase specialized sigma subunit